MAVYVIRSAYNGFGYVVEPDEMGWHNCDDMHWRPTWAWAEHYARKRDRQDKKLLERQKTKWYVTDEGTTKVGKL